MRNSKAGKWAVWHLGDVWSGTYETPEDAARAAMDREGGDSAIVAQWRRCGPVTLDLSECLIVTADGDELDLSAEELTHLETKLSVSLNQWMRHEVMSRHHCVIDEVTEQCITRRDLERAKDDVVA